MARWRPRLRALHRDVGYVCVGLVLVYAISGIAVNHRHQWDPDYVEEQKTLSVGRPAALLGAGNDLSPGVLARERPKELVSALLKALGRSNKPKTVFWRGADRLSLFFGEGERDVVDYHPSTGKARCLERRPRSLFRRLNVLHLNEARTFWTPFADGFAVALVFLALSGLVILRGKKGLAGRGKWLVLAGVLLPVIVVWLLG